MTFILPKEPKESDINKFVIVCEGMSDATFVDRLLRDLAINECCVGCPSDRTGGGQGAERIPPYLAGIRAITKDRKIISGVAVVADADRSLQKKFKVIRDGFKDAEFPRPARPYVIRDASMRVGVYFIPRKGNSGTLEHLLLEAAFKRRPAVEQCIEEFSSCVRTKTKTWTPNQRAKMKLSALISVTCQKNPWASCNTMWSDKGCPISIDSLSFKEIKQFLQDFTTP